MLCVEDAMTGPAMTLPPALCVADCIQLMRHTGVRMMPVLDACELVGILTFFDVYSGQRITSRIYESKPN